jgi:hypothetical protein
LRAGVGQLRGSYELLTLAFEGNQRLLDEIHFSSLEQRLAALGAHPGWDGISVDVIAPAIHAERSDTSLHPALAMDTLR